MADLVPMSERVYDPEFVAGEAETLAGLDLLIANCFACPRLVAWREEVAETKRAAFSNWDYWGRGVPGFGPKDARVLIVGLAPAAHGANRTGRMFTGDRSGDFLYKALHKVGAASQPTATAPGDGLQLFGVRITSPVHCAPPQNKPSPAERRTCAPYLARELKLLSPTLRSIVVLGGFGWQSLFATLKEGGWKIPRPRPRFEHGAQVQISHPDGQELVVFGCYHVSQQNTFTGKLTEEMLEAVLLKALTTSP